MPITRVEQRGNPASPLKDDRDEQRDRRRRSSASVLLDARTSRKLLPSLLVVLAPTVAVGVVGISLLAAAVAHMEVPAGKDLHAIAESADVRASFERSRVLMAKLDLAQDLAGHAVVALDPLGEASHCSVQDPRLLEAIAEQVSVVLEREALGRSHPPP